MKDEEDESSQESDTENEIDSGPEKDYTTLNQVMEEEEEYEEDTTRRVMFETDNWEECITESVWFG